MSVDIRILENQFTLNQPFNEAGSQGSNTILWKQNQKVQQAVILLILLGKFHIHISKFLRSCQSSVQLINNKKCAHTVSMLQECLKGIWFYCLPFLLSYFYWFLLLLLPHVLLPCWMYQPIESEIIPVMLSLLHNDA